MWTNSTLPGICKKHTRFFKKKKKPVLVTSFQNTNYSHSPFVMAFCSVETSWGAFAGKVSLHCQTKLFHRPGPTEKEYQLLSHCRCASSSFDFFFLFLFYFLKKYIPLWVLSCFKMLLLQQYLVETLPFQGPQPKYEQSAFLDIKICDSLDTW